MVWQLKLQPAGGTFLGPWLTVLTHSCTQSFEMHTIKRQYLELNSFDEEVYQTSSCVDLFTAATLEDDQFHLTLLSNVENINKQNKSGWTALMYACQSGDIHAAKLLLQYKADERICNHDGQTAVMLASAFGHEDILHLLSTKPSDVNRMDYKGWPSLMYAITFSHLESAKYLVQKGADVNFVDRISGQNLLMIAAADVELCGVLVPFLIGRGADHTSLSYEMKSAADFASKLGEKYEGIADYLRNPFQNQRQDKQPQSLQELLKSINMEKYFPLFEEKQIDLEQFMKFTENDLKNIGVRLLGPRKRMAGAIEDYVYFEARTRSPHIIQ